MFKNKLVRRVVFFGDKPPAFALRASAGRPVLSFPPVLRSAERVAGWPVRTKKHDPSTLNVFGRVIFAFNSFLLGDKLCN